MSLFSALTLAPRDPILGLPEAFTADPRPSKVILGVGVYTDDKGRLPLLSACAPPNNACLKRPRRTIINRLTATPHTTPRFKSCCSARIQRRSRKAGS